MVISNRLIIDRYIFKYLKEDSKGVYKLYKEKMRSVKVKDHLTNTILIYDSPSQASIATNIKYSTLANICRNKHKRKIAVLAGYSFMYLDETELLKDIPWPVISIEEVTKQRENYLLSYKNNCSSYHKRVYVKDTATGDIKVYLNLKESARANKVNYGTLRDHIYSRNLDGAPLRFFHGKIYRLEDDNRDWSTAIPVAPRVFHKQVIVKDYNTNKITIYPSMLKIAQKYSISRDKLVTILNTGLIYKGLVITTFSEYIWPEYTKEEVQKSL